jgi:alkanesulfonate monooxygenase SsuD/methylene tetrahydromethanopterin reductase-like flavin-dependent oxidoreductase (luciferase family)
MLEGNTALAALAARTSTLNLGLLVGGVTYRNPALIAKITTTLDVLSGGRAIFGIGAAWLEDEQRA